MNRLLVNLKIVSVASTLFIRSHILSGVDKYLAVRVELKHFNGCFTTVLFACVVETSEEDVRLEQLCNREGLAVAVDSASTVAVLFENNTQCVSNHSFVIQDQQSLGCVSGLGPT